MYLVSCFKFYAMQNKSCIKNAIDLRFFGKDYFIKLIKSIVKSCAPLQNPTDLGFYAEFLCKNALFSEIFCDKLKASCYYVHVL